MYTILSNFFYFLDDIFWGYLGFVLIIGLGLYFSFRERFIQIRALPVIVREFFQLTREDHSAQRGIHPLKVFFSSVGGMIGIGNVAGIVTAVQIGGPGALFWVWVSAPLGAMIKYSEIYLGIRYRKPNQQGGYDGGPMFFLKKAFSFKGFATLALICLCIYGVEIYQFSVLADSVAMNWHLPKMLVILVLLAMVLYAGVGGIPRIASICSAIIPIFMTLFVFMSVWILAAHYAEIPSLLKDVFTSAFQGKSALGGFAGASIGMAIKQGIARSAYSGDIGIGYDSIIQSESTLADPKRQGGLAMLGVYLDNLICSLSILVVLATGAWSNNGTTDGAILMQNALSSCFPGMNIFMPLLLFFTGFSTIIAFFAVGIKSARFLFPKFGEKLYFFLASLMMIVFSYADQSTALLVMSLSGGILMVLNVSAIAVLRKEIDFSGLNEVHLTKDLPVE